MDDVQRWLFETLLRDGAIVSPRGLPTRELVGVGFALTNPRRRCTTMPSRKWNLATAVGETCWHLAGSDRLDFIAYYLPRWRQFADNDCTVKGSAYGHKMFCQRDHETPSLWSRLVFHLREDRETRRAVLDLFDSHRGLDAGIRDASCTCTLQFMVRSGVLDLIVHMRSNDVVWGLPYDVFNFTMFQELLAVELNVPLGTYLHIVGSMHLYERHEALARRVLAAPECIQAFSMPSMPATGLHDQLRGFLAQEEAIRKGVESNVAANQIYPYWSELLDILRWHRVAITKGGYRRAASAIPEDSRYRPLLDILTLHTASGVELPETDPFANERLLS